MGRQDVRFVLGFVLVLVLEAVTSSDRPEVASRFVLGLPAIVLRVESEAGASEQERPKSARLAPRRRLGVVLSGLWPSGRSAVVFVGFRRIAGSA